MTAQQIAMMFDKLDDVNEHLSSLKEEVKSLRGAMSKVIFNTDSVRAGYQSHSDAIERMTQVVDRLRVQCPLIRPPTDEVEKVDC